MKFNALLPTTVETTCLAVLLVFLLQFVYRKMGNKGMKTKPPYAKGSYPIIGHLHLLSGSELPHKVLGDMAEKYGPIFMINLGVHQALVVSNGEMAKEIFTTNDKVFASRPKSVASELMAYKSAMFGFAPYGDYWRQVRKIIILEVLSQQRVEILGHVRVSELRASMKDIYDGWVSNSESQMSDTVKVEMQKWFGNLVLNIVVRIISGKRFSPNDEEGIHFQMVVRKFFELFGAFVVSDFIPYLKFLDMGGHIKAMMETRKDLDIIFEGWLNEQEIKRNSAHEDEGSEVFINVLNHILQEASEDEFPDFDHDTIIKSTCLQLLVAGLDTMSVTLTWALSLLLNNPRTLESAQAEIDEHVGRDRLVEESDVKNLVYLDAIIKETLRLHPAATLSVPHESMEDCTVGGYSIPKGTRLFTNLWKIHRDPTIWSDPYEFRPERFLTSQKDIDVKGSHFELLPFGSGRRMCPGFHFSLQTLRITVASLIQQFTLKRPSNEPIDMTESFGLTTSKATPLEVLLAPRLSANMYHA